METYENNSLKKLGESWGTLCKNNNMSKADEIKKLSELLKEGFLSDEEFKIEKEKILNQDSIKNSKNQASKNSENKSSIYSFDGRGADNHPVARKIKQKNPYATRKYYENQKNIAKEKNLQETTKETPEERVYSHYQRNKRTCKQCGGTAVKRARSRPGMLSMGVLAPKTMEKCKECGHRQTSSEFWLGGSSYGN